MKKYHWLPDLPDHRDFIYEHAPVTIPTKVDLCDKMSPVEDQGQLGSCTGNSIVGGLEYLENIKGGTFVDLSRLFVYYNERVIEGTVKQDAGAMIRDGIKSISDKGVCSELLWPYNITKFKKKPYVKCYKNALTRKVSSYSRLDTLDDMKNCLASGFPFVFGFTVYESFESQEVANTGIVNLPTKNEKTLGGHAVLAIGYDDSTQRFKVRNSWGSDWGDKGNFTIPYEYLANRNLSDDFWVVRS